MPDPRIIIIIVVVLIILIFALFLLYNTRPIATTTITQTRVANGSVINGTGLACGPGQCVTNIYNGAKICSTLQSENLIANPATEVCNSQFLCDNSLTPYALLSDGSTDNNGICQTGIACRCLRLPQCSTNIITVFSTSNGTAYQSFSSQRITITQNLVNTATTGTTGQSPNFQIQNPLIDFCTISNSWLNNLQPGVCNEVNPLTVAGVAQCQASNPCIAGTLAFIPSNINEFSIADINITPMGCVYGKPCDNNHLTVWNSGINEVVCFPIS
jgi:hypothetical protein